MDLNSVNISRLSTQYIIVPVQSTKAGEPYNPTGDTVQFAFVLNAGAVPTTMNWINGSWDVLPNYNYPYAAKCLVGPGIGAATALTTGTYSIWLQIFDNPETPVMIAGTLQII